MKAKDINFPSKTAILKAARKFAKDNAPDKRVDQKNTRLDFISGAEFVIKLLK